MDYDPIAGEYDRRYLDNEYPGVERTLVDCVGDAPGLHALEVGCGTGHWLGLLAERGITATGLDASTRMLTHARINAPSANLVHGLAERLPFAEDTFDRVFCINAFHHFSDRAGFLGEAGRVLRHGGSMLIVGLDPHTGLDRWFLYEYFEGTLAIDKSRFPSSREIRHALRATGFQDCRTFEAEHLEGLVPAEQALAAGRLSKTTTSQLGVLTDTEYGRGLTRVHEEAARARARGETLVLTSDLRLFATVASKGEKYRRRRR
ncbi:MAG: class I SAM-dependent methyltransferase [Deltaproteobacteria bacterium]|nr:class I SAM-dependent methyltransferase [Deltaproteobacteria bacterium]